MNCNFYRAYGQVIFRKLFYFLFLRLDVKEISTEILQKIIIGKVSVRKMKIFEILHFYSFHFDAPGAGSFIQSSLKVR